MVILYQTAKFIPQIILLYVIWNPTATFITTANISGYTVN